MSDPGWNVARQEYLEDMRLAARDALAAVVAAYDKAVRDGDRLPTALMCAVECARESL